MEVVKLYFETIIKPLEKEIKKQQLKVKKSRFLFTRKIEKEYLNKLEKLLNYYYNEFKIVINDELK